MIERSIPIIRPVIRWYCPACRATAVTRRADVHTQFHPCPRNGLINAPMVREGLRAKVEVHLREDYVGREHVQYDADGRPVMSVVITRDEGTDCAVYAPVAVANVRTGEGLT